MTGPQTMDDDRFTKLIKETIEDNRELRRFILKFHQVCLDQMVPDEDEFLEKAYQMRFETDWEFTQYLGYLQGMNDLAVRFFVLVKEKLFDRKRLRRDT